MVPSLEAIRNYREFNDVINAVLFDGRFAGAPLYLDIEGPVCVEIAKRLGRTTENFITDLAAITAGSFCWDKQDVFDWHTDMAKRWAFSGRATPPPYTALLCALSVAAESMRRDNQFESHNYYQRLFGYLRISGDSMQHKVRWSFKATKPLWDSLNRWLLDKEEELGRPTAQQINGFPYVSYPISQALIRDAERQNLWEMFTSFHFAPGERRTSVEMAVYLDQWVKTHHATQAMSRIWRSEDLKERFADAACDELHIWDGAGSRENGNGSLLYSPTWVCYLDRFPPPAAFSLNLTLPSTVAEKIGPLDVSTCKNSNDGMPLAGFSGDLFSNPCSMKAFSPSALPARLLQAIFCVILLKFKMPRRRSRSENLQGLYCHFCKMDTGGLYREVSRLSLLQPHLVLCHNEWRKRVSDYLKQAARPGYKEYTSETLKGLPSDWIVFENVEIVRLIHTDDNLLPLIPLTEISLQLQRGIRLTEDIWHLDAAPEALAATSEGPLRLEYVVETPEGRKVLANETAKDPCVRLDLKTTIAPAGVASSITVYQNQKRLKHKYVTLSSADMPRGIDVLHVPALASQLSKENVAGLYGAKPIAPHTSTLSLTGLIINGVASLDPSQTAANMGDTEIPSYGDDGEFLRSTLNTNAAETGPTNCVIRGHHIWLCQPHEAHQKRGEAKWAECTTCKKRYFARGRGKKKKEQIISVKKTLLPPPDIAQFEEWHPSIDTVL